jgi:hypothetical protein
VIAAVREIVASLRFMVEWACVCPAMRHEDEPW